MNKIPNRSLIFLVIDDHELLLGGTQEVLRKNYIGSQVHTARTAIEALEQLQNICPDLIIMDLSIPEQKGMIAQTEIGLSLLQKIIKKTPNFNLMVQSSNLKSLIRIKHDIDGYLGRFTLADKGLPEREIIDRVNWALQGITHTKDLNIGVEVKPEWLEVLRWAFEEGLQDKAIAKQINVSERMIRHYWTKLQDVLGVYPEEDKNLRVLTFKRAREEGLID
jgi:DNA-binding NarL/FixJ family response regulator